MTLSARITSAAFALALASSALGLANNAYADDAMKPAAMSSDEMTADCKAKAGMESDSMKKDEAATRAGAAPTVARASSSVVTPAGRRVSWITVRSSAVTEAVMASRA